MKGYNLIPKDLFYYYPQISITDAFILSEIYGYQKKFKKVYTSNKTIVQGTPISIRTLQSSIKKLFENGIINIARDENRRYISIKSEVLRLFDNINSKDYAKIKNAVDDEFSDDLDEFINEYMTS